MKEYFYNSLWWSLESFYTHCTWDFSDKNIANFDIKWIVHDFFCIIIITTKLTNKILFLLSSSSKITTSYLFFIKLWKKKTIIFLIKFQNIKYCIRFIFRCISYLNFIFIYPIYPITYIKLYIQYLMHYIRFIFYFLRFIKGSFTTRRIRNHFTVWKSQSCVLY